MAGPAPQAIRLRQTLGLTERRLHTVERASPPVPPPTPQQEPEFKNQRNKAAIAKAEEHAEDPRAVWTDGSSIEGGRSAGAVVTYELGVNPLARACVNRVGMLGIGRSRGRTVTYAWAGSHLAKPTASRWTATTFCLAGRQEAFDAELAALTRGIQPIAERREEGASYAVFTDPQAAMQRILSDAPGPGQGQATLAIRLAEIICQRGSTVDIRWVLGHRGLEGNEQVDRHARGVVEEEAATILGRRTASLACLKRQRTEKAHRLWREDIATQCCGGALQCCGGAPQCCGRALQCCGRDRQCCTRDLQCCGRAPQLESRVRAPLYMLRKSPTVLW